MHKKILFIPGLALLLFGGYYFFYRGSSAPVDAGGAARAAVKRGPLRVSVSATGRVVPELEVEIKCKASGEVVKLPKDVSNPVRKGDILVQLDPVDEERSIRKAEVSLAVSQARLEKARLDLTIAVQSMGTEKSRCSAALTSSEAKAREAASTMERIRQLREKQIASQEELDKARSADAQASYDLENARASMEDLKNQEMHVSSRREDIKIAEAQVESDRIALDIARQRLDDTTVRSPMDGVVVRRGVETGQIISSGISNVGGGTTVMTVADLSRMYVLVSVDESDIGRVKEGQEARITVEAYPDMPLKGKVVRVSTKGATASNIVTFEVKVEVTEEKRGLLKPEMSANVEITCLDLADALLAPVSAVERRRGGMRIVTVESEGKTEERPVKTGASDGEYMEVLEGVKEGETVLLGKAESQSRWHRDRDGTQKPSPQQGQSSLIPMPGPPRRR